MRNKIAAVLVSAAMLTALTGCQKEIAVEELPVLNYTAPEQGEEIVVIHVKDRGDIKIKLFPELLPEACENFLTHAKNGYYDELIFHRVIEGFMIQGGDPKGDGTGGESCWGGKFNGSVTEQLIHVPGALAYANSAGPATDGSQFYIVTGDSTDAETLKFYEEEYDKNPQIAYDINFTKEAEELYIQHGGAPHLDGGYAAFGRVTSGMETVDEIATTETGMQDRPVKEQKMKKVTVEDFGQTFPFNKL